MSTVSRIDQREPTRTPLRIVADEGSVLTLDYLLELMCTAGSTLGTTATTPLTTAACFDANFTRTVRWGGIQSVTDEVTGELVTDWTITSASGFDYRYAAPEPASLTLLGLASLWIVPRRHRSMPLPVWLSEPLRASRSRTPFSRPVTPIIWNET